MHLSEKEQRVLAVLKQNPFISQQQVAEQLNMPRSTVANVIAQLVEKQWLLGRAYIINEQPRVCCIGAMNSDRKCSIIGSYMPKTSNPVRSQMSVGGVARNIAENLGRLGEQVHLVSIVGADHEGQWLKQQTQPYVSLQAVTQLSEATTSSYTAILDAAGDMQLALADMSICDRMDLSWIIQHKGLLQSAKLLVLDLNVPLETAAFVIDLAKNHRIDLVVVPVSAPKMNRLPQALDGVTWLIVNQDESEAFFNTTVTDDRSLQQIAQRWIDVGVANVLITRGRKASCYANNQGQSFFVMPPTAPQVVDVTGAGDAFAAGLIFGQLQQADIKHSIELAMANAYHTIQVPQTVRLDLTKDILYRNTQQLFEKE